MTYTDMDCGIAEPHRHTGELVEGYHIEYWCPTLTAWITERHRTSYDNKCTCLEPHMKARIQHICTEIIEIFDPADYDIVEWLKKELKERFYYRLFYGEIAYNDKYGGEDNAEGQGNAPSGDGSG